MTLLLMGCKSKKVLKTSVSETEKTQILSENKQENKIENELQKQETKKTEVSEQKKETSTDIEVKGKATDDKPLEVYNIENGDTIQAIKVTGNAEVHVRAKASKSNQKKNENSSESLIDKFKEFSESIVEENNVKERVQEAKKKSKEVNVKGFQAGTWIVITIVMVFLLFIFFTYKYFKK